MNWMIALNGHALEYVEDGHVYVCDGVILPSITQILSKRFGGKYKDIDKAILDKAAAKGNAVHKAIEEYCTNGTESDLVELKNFKWLQKQYGFEVLANELPVILFDGERPVAAGRLDLVLKMNDVCCGADIKRTATLDKEYVAYQLNLYRIAYRQCYGIEWSQIFALHLRDDVRKMVVLPINEGAALELVKEYERSEK